MNKLLVIACSALISGSPVLADYAHRWMFDFAVSDHGFVGGFADIPIDYDPASYQLIADRRPRPVELGSSPAMFISGNNHSDDLWMFWKKKLTGLEPETAYVLTIEVELASNVATGLVGIGGSPGDSVYVKTGASAKEPLVIVDNSDWLRMNLDKGNQSIGGEDIAVRGTIAKPVDGNEEYVYLTRHHHGTPQVVTTASDGSFWIIFGTDSGFEGTTSIFYTHLTVWANRMNVPYLWLENSRSTEGFKLIWNNGNIQSSTDLNDWLVINDVQRPMIYQPNEESKRFWRLVLEEAANISEQ